MGVPPRVTITRTWRVSGSGMGYRQQFLRAAISHQVMLIVSVSFLFFGGGVLIDCPRSVLYVLDLVRFRQMAAGVH